MPANVLGGAFLGGLIIGALVTNGLVRDSGGDDAPPAAEPAPATVQEYPPSLVGLHNVSMSPPDIFCAQQGMPFVHYLPTKAAVDYFYSEFLAERNDATDPPAQLMQSFDLSSFSFPLGLYGNSEQEFVSVPLNCATHYTDVVCPNNGVFAWAECMYQFFESGTCDAWLDAVYEWPSDGFYYFMAVGVDTNQTAVTYRTRCVPDRHRKRVIAVDAHLLDTCDVPTRDFVLNYYGWSLMNSDLVDLTGITTFEAPCRDIAYIYNITDAGAVGG